MVPAVGCDQKGVGEAMRRRSGPELSARGGLKGEQQLAEQQLAGRTAVEAQEPRPEAEVACPLARSL